MEYSKYNHLCSLDTDNRYYLLYNFLTCALLKLDEKHRIIYEHILETTNFDNLKQVFLKNGFLIDGFDELGYLKLGNKLTCTDNELLSVLITPTMACNFRCPYCFEQHGSDMMSEQIQNAVVQFIEKSIQENRHKRIFVYWFGGEPLLGIDIIDSMSQKILSIADKYSVVYSSAMSTNGYLLTPEKIKILEKAKIDRIQITLDGMKETNDKTRILLSGDGSFDVIVANLKAIRTNIKIQVRSNLHKRNFMDFSQLKQLITSIAQETDVDISIYGAHMASYEFNNENIDDMVLPIEEFSSVLKKFGITGNIKTNHSRFAFCDAAKIYSYCFDERGYMYKCWNDIGNPSHAYDNVFSALERDLNICSSNATDFLAHSFPENSECLSCKILPICMGGCILKRVVEKHKTCSPLRYNLDDYVNKLYLESTGVNFSDIGN